jgi:hypothetical protein
LQQRGPAGNRDRSPPDRSIRAQATALQANSLTAMAGNAIPAPLRVRELTSDYSCAQRAVLRGPRLALPARGGSPVPAPAPATLADVSDARSGALEDTNRHHVRFGVALRRPLVRFNRQLIARSGPRASEKSARSYGYCLASGKQIATAEVVNRQHDALEIVPPDRGTDVEQRLPDGPCDQPQRRQPIIFVQGLAVVAAHAVP